MALFKLRKGRDEPPVPVAPAQTVEAMRRRAMHRLIGAAILVLAGVIGFPALFDNQPRPIPVDLPIVIPDKANVPALVAPAATVVNAASSPPAAPAPAPVVPPAVVVEAPRPSPPVVAAKPAPASADVPAVPNKPVPTRVDDAGKARDLLEGKEPGSKAVAAEGRFIVQVGAFADADKVREVRQKVEALGLKTYTQVIDTKDGSRTRVRVGPFTDKAEATRTAEKIRKLGVPASILSL